MLTAVIPVVGDKSSLSVPSPLTKVTGTVQVMPPSLVVGVPINPVPSVPDRLKLAAETPVTAALKLTVKLLLLALLSAALTRLMLLTVALMTVRAYAWVKLLPPASVTWIST